MGEPGAAEPLRRALEGETPNPLARLMALYAAAVVAADDGRLGQAKACADAARRIVDSGGLRQTPQSSLASAAAGAVLARQGRLEGARSELERALRSQRPGFGLSPWVTLETEPTLAEVLRNLGDGSGAAAVLAEAEDVLAALPDGAEAQRARLERLQHQPARELAEPLSNRELAVLRLLRGPLPVSKIAREMERSPNTIKSPMRASYRKLGVSTRRDAVTRARELCLL